MSSRISAACSGRRGRQRRAGQRRLAGTFNHTFWWALGFTVIGALPVLLLRRPERSAG